MDGVRQAENWNGLSFRNKSEIVSALESQQYSVSSSWTSDGAKGEQDLGAAETFNREGRKGDRKGR